MKFTYSKRILKILTIMKNITSIITLHLFITNSYSNEQAIHEFIMLNALPSVLVIENKNHFIVGFPSSVI